jgi:hypothetical protein
MSAERGKRRRDNGGAPEIRLLMEGHHPGMGKVAQSAVGTLIVAAILGLATLLIGSRHLPTTGEMSAIHTTLKEHTRAQEDMRISQLRTEAKVDLLLTELGSLRLDFDKTHPRVNTK